MASTTLSTVNSFAGAAFSKSRESSSPTPSPSSSSSVVDNKGRDNDKNQLEDAITPAIDPTESSDEAPSLSSSFPSFDSFSNGLTTKDQRAYEHSRQKAIRSEEYVRMREGKALRQLGFGRMRFFSGSSPRDGNGRDNIDVKEGNGNGNGPTTSRRKERRIGSELDSSSSVLDEEDGVLDVLEGVRTRKESMNTPPHLLGHHPHHKPEVKLADLITLDSIRKSRKNKGVMDPEFELIPAVRSVIVLDEQAFMHDTPMPMRDLEGDWEHVCHGDGDGRESDTARARMTYATVVVTGHGSG